MKKAVKDFARDPFRQDVWDTLAAGMRYVATEFDDDAGEDRVGQALEELDAERGTQGNRLYYLAVPPQAFAIDGDRDRRAAGEGRLGAPHRRKAVRPRSGVGAGAERAAAPLVHGGRDLPHRPLSRQGDGAEHAGTALRERHLRADLEPAVHRSRADHRGRVDGDRGPRRLLRVRGGDPRHLPESPAAAARADGDGAADRLHGRLGAQREGEGAEGDAHARAEVRRARPVRPRLRRGRRGAGLPGGGGCRARAR